MTVAIDIKNLTKNYNGQEAVDNLSLIIEQGEIFGFVGPNGAGKTTTIRMIAGLLKPTRGAIHLLGYPINPITDQVKRAIGFMPDFFGLYPDLKVWEYLDFFGSCYRIPEDERSTLIEGLLDLVELRHRREDLVSSLSRGMQQRLSLARTLIHDPQVLLLDEPAAGLDPRARVEIRELMLELSHMGKTIFFSTHILADVAEICSRIGIIEAGRLVAVGGLEELHMQLMPRRNLEIDILDNMDSAKQILQETEGVTIVELQKLNNDSTHGRLLIEFSGDDAGVSNLLTRLIQAGIPILHFSEDNKDLEGVFLQATKGIVS